MKKIGILVMSAAVLSTISCKTEPKVEGAEDAILTEESVTEGEIIGETNDDADMAMNFDTVTAEWEDYDEFKAQLDKMNFDESMEASVIESEASELMEEAGDMEGSIPSAIESEAVSSEIRMLNKEVEELEMKAKENASMDELKKEYEDIKNAHTKLDEAINQTIENTKNKGTETLDELENDLDNARHEGSEAMNELEEETKEIQDEVETEVED